METCKSPRKVMRMAWCFARRTLDSYSNKYSRHDFTLAQLFACLVIRELLGLSYRKLEAFLRDTPDWMADLGMVRVPDHNTLCRASARLLKEPVVKKLLDEQIALAAHARLLGLSRKPLAIDSSMYESHHVSRHYELRRSRAARKHKKDRKSKRNLTVRSLPKLALAVDCRSHLALSLWTGSGMGSDSPQFEQLLFDAWRRVPNKRFKVVADAGYDGEHNHELARNDMGLRSIIPATVGRTPRNEDRVRRRWRRRMRRQLKTKRSRRHCGYTQRWQIETANSMMKRNLGSSLRGKTNQSRMHDLRLKVLTHNLMILR
jgi:hypothetical protein